MDKPKKNAENETIKVEVAGKERPFTEEMVITDWNKAANEAAATEESRQPEEFRWVLPDETEMKASKSAENVKERKSLNVVNMMKQTKNIRFRFRNLSPENISMIFAIVMAIVIGLAFGIFVLKMVFHTDQEATSAVNSSRAVVDKTKDGNASGQVAVKMQGMTAAVIQGGVFTTTEAANQYSEQFKEKGYPTAMIEIDGKKFLFIGLAAEISTAKSWATQLTNQGEEVYAKQLTIPEKDLKLSTKEETKALSDSTTVFQTLAEETANASFAGMIDESILTQVANDIKKNKESKINQATVKQLQGNLSTAYDHLVKFNESGNRTDLVSAQQALLNYLQIYYESG